MTLQATDVNAEGVLQTIDARELYGEANFVALIEGAVAIDRLVLRGRGQNCELLAR